MSKTFKTKSTTYDVTATVVLMDTLTSEVKVSEFSGEGADTKSVRALKKSIISSYDGSTYKVLAVENIQTAKVESVRSFTVDASIAQILDACRANGLSVTEIIG